MMADMDTKRRSRKPQVVQNEVLARTLAAQSNSRIAREMGIDRQTVTRIQECHNLPQLLADSRQYVVEHVVPDAIESVHAQIIDRDSRGDGDLGARVLEKVGVLSGDSARVSLTFQDNAALQVAIALLPPAAPADSADGASAVPPNGGDGPRCGEGAAVTDNHAAQAPGGEVGATAPLAPRCDVAAETGPLGASR